MISPVLGIFITILLVLANAFFVAAEFAIVKVRASQIELRVQSGSKAARMAQSLVTHLDAYLSATQLGITLSSLGLGWVGEPIVAQLIIGAMRMIGIEISENLAHKIALPIAFAIITILHIVLGELAPKSLAIQRPEQVTLALAYPLRFFYIIFKPFIVALNGLANVLLRSVGIPPAGPGEHVHSNEELRLLLEQGREGGTIEETEHELLENVFEFREKVVKEVMIPRTKIVALDAEDPPEELARMVIEEGYTRMPVYIGSLDTIIGVVYSKDLIALKEHADLIILHDLLRPVYFVPETQHIADLLREFQRRKIHLAIVVDEFGGTAGLITLEDILEELVGEIQDEYDEESVGVERLNDNTWIINASLSIADANDLIEGFVLPDGEDYTTIGGLATKWFGRIPNEGESYERDGLRMTILKTYNNRVVQVQIEDLNPQEPDNGLHAFPEEEGAERQEQESE